MKHAPPGSRSTCAPPPRPLTSKGRQADLEQFLAEQAIDRLDAEVTAVSTSLPAAAWPAWTDQVRYTTTRPALGRGGDHGPQ
jgi:hypothetical protein